MRIILNLLYSTFTLCIVLFFPRFGSAQSLYEEFLNEKNLEKKSEMAEDFKDHYIKNRLDSLLILGYDLINDNVEDTLSFEALGRRYLGSAWLRKGDFQKSIRLLEQAASLFDMDGRVIELSETYNELGNAYFSMGNYSSASKAYWKSVEYGEGSTDETAAYNGLIGLGKTYCSAGDTVLGVKLIRSFLDKVIKVNKYESAADACAYLGMVFGMKGQDGLSQAYYSISIDYAKMSSSKTHLANAYTNMAILNFDNKDFDSARYLFKKALDLRKDLGNARTIVESYFNLGIFELSVGDLSDAVRHFEQGLRRSSEAGLLADERDLLNELEVIYTQVDNHTELKEIQQRKQIVLEKLEKGKEIDVSVTESLEGMLEAEAASTWESEEEEEIDVVIWLGAASLAFLCLTILYVDRRLN